MTTYAGHIGDCKCECSDPRCPAHYSVSDCKGVGNQVLYRIDMEDNSGTAFCDACAEDAMDSGLFWDGENDPADDDDDNCDCVPCSNCGGVEQADDCTDHNAIDRHV